jgi:hypothetical protein
MSNSSSEMRIGDCCTLRVTSLPDRLSFLLSQGGHTISQTNFWAHTRKPLWDYLVSSLRRDLRRCGGKTHDVDYVEELIEIYEGEIL